MTAALTELAEKVEQLTGPCRETDAFIHHHVNRERYLGSIERSSTVPAYTGSLDAAITLVPEGWWLTLDRFLISDDPNPNGKTWRVWLKRFVGDIEDGDRCYQQKILASGATPALALTAAALRSRASMETGHEG